MSRGIVDQAYVDSCKWAIEVGKARGLKPVNTAISHNPDGSRTFHWRFDPIEKPGRGKAAQPASTPVQSGASPISPPKIKRGGVPRPVQEELSL